MGRGSNAEKRERLGDNASRGKAKPTRGKAEPADTERFGKSELSETRGVTERSDGLNSSSAEARSRWEARPQDRRRGSPRTLDSQRTLSTEQRAQVDALKTRLSGLSQNGVAAEDEIRKLASDLQDMAVQPPDPALVQDLAHDLQSALADSTLSPMEMAELSQSIYAVLNSAGLEASEIQVLITDIEAILLAANVSSSDVQAVADSLQAVAGSLQAPSTRPPSRKALSRGSRLQLPGAM